MEEIYCEYCKKAISEDDEAIQIRQGYIEDGEFLPDEDYAYYHYNCFTEEVKNNGTGQDS